MERLSGSLGVAWVALHGRGWEMAYLGLHKRCTVFPGPSLLEPVRACLYLVTREHFCVLCQGLCQSPWYTDLHLVSSF